MHQAAKNAVAPRPRLRRVPIEALTGRGWLNGTLHVPSHLALSDFLALGSQPLKLTEAQVPDEPDRLAFVALRRDALVIVAPGLAEEGDGAEPSAYTTDLQIACLLPMGLLRGTLRVIYNLRLSDHLRLQSGFIVVRDAQWTPHRVAGEAQQDARRTLPCVLVNAALVIGIEEVEPRPSAG